MKKSFVYSVILLSMLCASTEALAQSSMTDKQVLEYVKQGVSSGKSQKVIMQELVARGVDRAQAARVKKLYESQNAEVSTATSTANADRSRSISVVSQEEEPSEQMNETAAQSKEETLKWRSSESVDPMALWKLNENELADEDDLSVFGRNIFKNKNLSFAPSENIPTPRNYVLGPGDEVIVDVFGANQSTLRSVISPDGYINVDVLGPIFLSGKSVEAANAYLKNRLSSIYGGLADEDAATDIQLSIGQIRSIQVTVVGDVETPGNYVVPSLSTVFHALFQTGGVKEPGTIRSIKLMRNGKQKSLVDVYDLLINGTRNNDVRLEEGDVILVEPYLKLVKVSGEVKRPMLFELKDGETLKDLFKFAGGFTKSAFSETATVVRQMSDKFEVFNVDASQFGTFVLQNGDEIEVKAIDARFENRIKIQGAVFIPGVYELSPNMNSVRKLVQKAGGLQPDAFVERGVIRRRNADKTLETIALDLKGIVDGAKPDVPLQNNDEVFVYSIFDINDRGTLTIEGEVSVPGTFPFAANTTVQDLILQAGGLLRSASAVRVDVARLISDNESLVAQNVISTYFTFSIQNGFAVDGADKFVLEPYDVVTVRRSPSFVANRTVSITGEVNFPGTYNMSKREERITDLLAKAGDITDFAYVKGARLMRRMTEEERMQYQAMSGVIANEGDTVQQVEMNNTYSVAFDLVDAIKNPGGENDLVLRQGDVLDIPVYNNTVRIDGAVQMPTTIRYRHGLNKRNLVNAAGGYAKRAYKHKAFIVYMNGRVSKLRRFTDIEPGAQIFVPKKEKKEGQLQNIMSISTTAASLGMMGVSIANLLK